MAALFCAFDLLIMKFPISEKFYCATRIDILTSEKNILHLGPPEQVSPSIKSMEIGGLA